MITRRPTFKETRALVVLAKLAPNHYTDTCGCSDFGALYFGNNRSGRVSASTGGGDYAAQMVLGRLRKNGWAETTNKIGGSAWALTYEGRKIAEHWGQM